MLGCPYMPRRTPYRGGKITMNSASQAGLTHYKAAVGCEEIIRTPRQVEPSDQVPFSSKLWELRQIDEWPQASVSLSAE